MQVQFIITRLLHQLTGLLRFPSLQGHFLFIAQYMAFIYSTALSGTVYTHGQLSTNSSKLQSANFDYKV